MRAEEGETVFFALSSALTDMGMKASLPRIKPPENLSNLFSAQTVAAILSAMLCAMAGASGAPLPDDPLSLDSSDDENLSLYAKIRESAK